MMRLIDIYFCEIIFGLILTVMVSCGSVDVDPTFIVECNTTGPVLFLTASKDECGSNGSIEVMITGGVGDLFLTISPDPSAVLIDGVYVDLPPDIYTITVTDDNNCSNAVLITLGVTSYADVIAPIINTSCAIVTCHDGSNTSVTNWTVLSNVQNKASEIKNRTGNRSMPPANQSPLELEEIEAIACWVDLGAMDN